MSLPDVDGRGGFEQSFDFSKFPNLQEVNLSLRVVWMGGGLPWIPKALSTLRPATSPHLSSIRLDFGGAYIVDLPVEPLTKDTGDDLRQVADEVARIESEFGGAVNFTVVSDAEFEAVLNTLGVRPRFAVLMKPPGRADSFLLVPCRSFGATAVEM